MIFHWLFFLGVVLIALSRTGPTFLAAWADARKRSARWPELVWLALLAAVSVWFLCAAAWLVISSRLVKLLTIL
jgi:hypothetical protein